MIEYILSFCAGLTVASILYKLLQTIMSRKPKYTVHETLHRDERELDSLFKVYEIRKNGQFILGIPTHQDFTDHFNARVHAANIAYILNRETKKAQQRAKHRKEQE